MKLAQYCEPEAAQKESQALEDVTNMTTEPPSKNMIETRNKVTELEQRLKHAEDIAESDKDRIPEWHNMQILQHFIGS